MAEALYRKYRPQVFGDVVGQEHIERTIKNALASNQVSHAYLFCGPRGTGKTTMARLLAKALLCESGPTPEPDGSCEQCREIADGLHPDVYELDAASRTGVENVRDEIIGRVNFAPTRGSYKVYIIDEVHMLSTAAFNALLKTLEEPPAHVVFILCTTDPQKVPETIHSRCQRFDFHRLSTDEIVTRLGAVCMAEGVEFEGDALELVAHRAEGGMRNALTSLEQLIAFGDGKVTVTGAEDLLGSLATSDMAEIIQAVGRRDVAACFAWTDSYVENGADLAQFARDMASHVRNLYVMSFAGSDTALDIPEAERHQLAEELGLFGPDRLARLLGVLGDLVSDLRTATNPRLVFEIALTRMVRPDSDLTLEALAERVEALEGGYAAVTTVVAPEPAGDGSTSDAPLIGHAPSCAPLPHASNEPASRAFRNSVRTDAELAPAGPCAGDFPAEPASGGGLAASEGSPADAGLASLLGNPTALQRAWLAVTSSLKKDNAAFAAMLVGVRARASEDRQCVRIEFPATNPISLSMARKPENQRLLSEAFQRAAGFAVPYELASASEQVGFAGAPAASEAGAPAASEGFPQEGPSAARVSAPARSGSSQHSGEIAPQSGEAGVLKPSGGTPPADPFAGDFAAEPAGGGAPEDERVPLDAYEGVPFVPDAPDAAKEQPAAAPTSVALDPAGDVPASSFADSDVLPPEPGQMGAEDLSKMATEAFGGAIVFEEVDD